MTFKSFIDYSRKGKKKIEIYKELKGVNPIECSMWTFLEICCIRINVKLRFTVIGKLYTDCLS